jgi:ERCC4-type nuclease
LKRYYTDKEYRQLIKHMVVLVDTRDQSNRYILEEFEKQKIQYKKKALKTGDYSLLIEACPELGFAYDTYFTDELCIERKNSVSELAGNLANKSDGNRIFKELNRMINIERVYLVIENDCLDDIYEHNYKSEYNPESYIRTLLTWQARNNMHVYFVKKENMARTIYELCKNCLDSKILKS